MRKAKSNHIKQACFSAILLLLFSWPGYAFDFNQCFQGYAASGTLVTHFDRCVQHFRGEPLNGSINSMISQMEMDVGRQNPQNPPTDSFPWQSRISQAAQTSYNNDSICGTSGSLSGVYCNRLRQLSLLHSTGLYQFRCSERLGSHTSCAELAPKIVAKLGSYGRLSICDQTNEYKNQCNALVSGLLGQSECSARSSESTCLSKVDEFLGRDTCDISAGNFDQTSCLGSSVADAGFGANPGPAEEGPIGGGDTAGTGSETAIDPTGGNQDVTNSDAGRLAGLARNLGGWFNNNMNMRPTSPTNVPTSSASSNLNADGSPGGGVANGNSLGPEGSNHLGLSTQLPIPTEQWPHGGRGRDQAPGGAPGDGGNGAGMGGFMGGAPMGGNNLNAGGSGGRGAGAGRSGGGGNYRSSYSAIADSLGGNNFLGTSGGGANAAAKPEGGAPVRAAGGKGGPGRPDPSRMKGQINAAFQQGLRSAGQGSNELLPQGGYFPTIQDAYDRLYRQGQVLGDNGDLLSP